jgi:hypothetical protein
MYMSTGNKPIGWWLTEVARLPEESFARVLAADGLRRRHWQLLNAVGDGTGRPALEAALAPFWPAAEAERRAELDGLLDHLVARGWVRAAAQVGPTSEGVAARSRIGAAIGEARGRILDGISAEDYQLVVATLRRMAGNLA